MADSTLHVVANGTNQALASAYFEAALAFEDLALDVERARDTAHCLAASESFTERDQNVIYAIGDLCDRILTKTKLLEDRFTSSSEKHRES